MKTKTTKTSTKAPIKIRKGTRLTKPAKGTLEFQHSSDITFMQDGKESIRLSKGKFYCQGKVIDDIHQMYERLNQWLIKASIK
jgi:ethanolamine utilization cobalamin adenosyltransferase